MKIRSNKLLSGRNAIIYTKRHYFGVEWQFNHKYTKFYYFRIYYWTKQGTLPRYKNLFNWGGKS